MKIALVGAELEENLGLRYMTAVLEQRGHQVEIIPFNSTYDISPTIEQIQSFEPEIIGLSMVFTSRALEFCRLAQTLRTEGYRGHMVAGGHFAALNSRRLLEDYQAIDSVALGEGEELICMLADHLDELHKIAGLCYRLPDGTIQLNPSTGNMDNLDSLPFPKRTSFHKYFDMPIASILSSRGCWRNCAFCSINAWYESGGGKKFRIRSPENIVAEMKQLYFDYGVRIFNFQDDNFFLPNPEKALQRFEALRTGLKREGITDIAIAVKARPDSINVDSIRVLDELGLFRVFLGVENASERGLKNLNRKCTYEQIIEALRVLNDFDVHIAFNILMFEPDAILDDILINLRFIERNVENPFNFCRAEAYAGTGLEDKLRQERRLLGDYFGFDYRLKDPHCEAFHQIANYAFFDRNFSNFGLHYFNMQVDFYFQLLRRFYPEVLTESLRAEVRNFIKLTNIDTYRWLCQIYDFIATADPSNHKLIRTFAKEMRQLVDSSGKQLRIQGENIQSLLGRAYENRDHINQKTDPVMIMGSFSQINCQPIPYQCSDRLDLLSGNNLEDSGAFMGIASNAVPYDEFRRQLERQKTE